MSTSSQQQPKLSQCKVFRSGGDAILNTSFNNTLIRELSHLRIKKIVGITTALCVLTEDGRVYQLSSTRINDNDTCHNRTYTNYKDHINKNINLNNNSNGDSSTPPNFKCHTSLPLISDIFYSQHSFFAITRVGGFVYSWSRSHDDVSTSLGRTVSDSTIEPQKIQVPGDNSSSSYYLNNIVHITGDTQVAALQRNGSNSVDINKSSGNDKLFVWGGSTEVDNKYSLDKMFFFFSRR